MNTQWNDKLSIEVELIGNEHKELLKITNPLTEVCTNGKIKEKIGKTLEFLFK